MIINDEEKYKEECEKLLSEYRTEEFKIKVNKMSSFKIIDDEEYIAIYKFFKNKELTTKEYKIMLIVIHDVIMKEHDKLERLIEW